MITQQPLAAHHQSPLALQLHLNSMANLAKLVEVPPETVASLEAKLRAPETSLPEKYRVLFSLRNIQGREAHEALELGE